MTPTDPALIARVEDVEAWATYREFVLVARADLRALLARIRELEAERDAARTAAINACIAAARDERVSLDCEEDIDKAYNLAIEHVIQHLRSLASAPAEGGG